MPDERPKTRKALVALGAAEPVAVEVPADHPDPLAAAVIAYRAATRTRPAVGELSVRFEDESEG